MKNQTRIPVTINLPPKLHRLLCTLATVAECTPEAVAAALLKFELEDTIYKESLECVVPLFRYATRAQAKRVAEAANSYEEHQTGNNYREARDDNGEFYAEAGWLIDEANEARAEKRRQAEKVIVANFG